MGSKYDMERIDYLFRIELGKIHEWYKENKKLPSVTDEAVLISFLQYCFPSFKDISKDNIFIDDLSKG